MRQGEDPLPDRQPAQHGAVRHAEALVCARGRIDETSAQACQPEVYECRTDAAARVPSLTGIEAPCDSKTCRSITEQEMAMRITSKGQVTIPVEIRERLGLLPNSEVEFAVEGSAVRLRKARGRKRGRGRSIVAHLRGKATSGLTTDQIMALTRGEK